MAEAHPDALPRLGAQAAGGSTSLYPDDHRDASRTGARQSAAQRFAAGAVASVVSRTACAPLDRIKLLNQTGSSRTGPLATFRAIVQQEGWQGLWRGNIVNCQRVIPSKGVLLCCSDMYRDALRPLGLETFALGAAAGALAGATSVVCTYPMDLARARISATFATDPRASSSVSLISTLSNVARQEGITALYRGAGLTLAGSFPYEGIKFGVYDALRAAVARRQTPDTGGGGSPSAAAGALTKAYCGAAAALVANLFMYPNDTLRRRLQMQGAGGGVALSAPQVALFLIRSEGPAAFYRGVGATLLRAVPSTGIQFGAYELAKSIGRGASAG